MAHISVTGMSNTNLAITSYSSQRSSQSQLSNAPSSGLQDALSDLSSSLIQQSESDTLEESSFSLIRPKGDPFNLYQDNPELKEKAKNLAERLDGPIHEANAGQFFYHDSMRDFLHAGVLTDPEFLDMAESMSDEALQDLAVTIKAMILPASANYTTHNEADRSYQKKVAEFMDVLKSSNTEDRGAILEQSAKYAGQVDVDAAASFTQNVFGQKITQIKFDPYRNDTSANNLHNYVTAVVATDDPSALTEQLGQMSNEAQSGLLSVYGLDATLGDRLAQLVGSEGDQLPDSLLSALGDMVDSVKISELTSQVKKDFGIAWHGNEALLKDNEESQGRDFALDSVTSMINMLEQYDFSEEQLETMGSELSGLSNPEKRAYIEITTIGLDDMLQAKVSENSNKKNLEEAVAVVSELRNNQDVLSLVNGSRYHDVTLVERPDIEEGQTVVALEGAAVFKNLDTAVRESRILMNAFPENTNMVNGHSVKGHESENIYSAKTFDEYKQDVGNMVSTLVAFESARSDSTANDKMSLNAFAETLADMHSGIRDETLQRVSDEIVTDSFRNKITENTQLAFLSNVVQQMAFETQRDFEESANRSV